MLFRSQYFQAATGGFLTHDVSSEDGVTDAITTAHLGLAMLEAGKVDIATQAGKYLISLLNKQPNLEEGFYLRQNAEGKLLTEFSDDQRALVFIDTQKENQLYFMLAYPVAFLTLLEKSTKATWTAVTPPYIKTAIEYMNFLLSCHESVYSSEFSHKVAWACSLLYTVVQDKRYIEMIDRISQAFIDKQDQSGLWYKDDPLKSYDQSAEIGLWFSEIRRNLECVQHAKIQQQSQL